MADATLGDVVMMAEGKRPNIGPCSRSEGNAAPFLVCRLLTDAIFSNDIRAMQLIIIRIDGGLPRDTEIDDYQTKFSDCLREVMEMRSGEQLKLVPSDTVIMALCKSLYALSVQDIYWDDRVGKMRRPSTDKKQERDAALRMILERIGGRKTLVESRVEREEIEDANWIASLPSVV